MPDPDPEIRGLPGPEKFFSPLQASVWSKNKGVPPLDPPLTTPATVSIEKMLVDHFITLLVVRINLKT